MLNIVEGILMVNQVNDSANLGPLDSSRRLKSNPQETKKVEACEMKSAEHLDLSPIAKQLEAIKDSLQDIPEINTARVLYFKSEIELGNYQIDSSNLAKKMANQLEMA